MKAQDAQLRRNIYVLLAGFIVLTLGLIAGAVQHQVIKREQYQSRAKDMEIKRVRLTPLRGRILDRLGNPLALSLEAGSVFAHPWMVKNPKETAAQLAGILGRKPRQLEAELKRKVSFTWLARQIPLEKAEAVQKLKLEGIGMEKEGKRYYPNRELAGHVIGFAGVDSQGLEGLELRFDSYLRGPEVTLMLQHDAYGRVLWQEVALQSVRKAACELHLTLDLRIQYVAEQALGRAVQETGALSGTAVAMDPKSGEVLAIACVPKFNPNSFPDYSSDAWRNRAIADMYEPGSTLKAVLLSAALEEGVVNEETLFDCEKGHFAYGGRIIHDLHPYGVMSVREVIARSSNIGTAKIADRLGAKTLWTYLNLFGFGQPAGVDLPGEASGSLLNWRAWAKVAVANHAFGQGFSITALQLANTFSTLANGGFRVEPYIVARIVDETGSTVVEKRPRAVARVLSERTTSRVLSVLETVVEDGTGKLAQIPGFRVGGKTGTAQVYDPATGTYSDTRSVASFVGIVPVDRPDLVISVVINEPRGKASGGRMAAPVFREIALHGLHFRGVKPGEIVAADQSPSAKLWANATAGRKKRLLAAVSDPTTAATEGLRMPDLRRLPLRSALRALDRLPVEIGLDGSGTVLAQEPAPGTPIQAGETVRIQASPRGWKEAGEAEGFPEEESYKALEKTQSRAGTGQI